MAMKADQPPFPLVAIGASAGGVKALQRIFEKIPADTGACFVVIVHLDPERESHLSDIIAARTSMSVTMVESSVPLVPNSVYVIPPNRRLQITDHEIGTYEFDEPRGLRTPIDFFFRSFADQHGDGFAIVLSGAGADGSVGVKAVKEAGGIVMVQDPQDAEYASMPRSAIATGVADLVLPIAELAEQLPQLISRKVHLRAQTFAEGEEEVLRRVLGYLRARTGHDFSKYKHSTVQRRVTRRMQLSRKETLEEYYIFLRENVEEVQGLFADLLISVTTFFRDGDAFQLLADRVIPRLFEDKEAGDFVRVWIPGCATGEEAYSICMLLLEEAARYENPPEIQIFASDLDSAALAIAREGRYPTSIEADVSEERLRRFFVREGQYFRIRREVRDLVLFATHSLLKDPPFSRLDMISCRNLLIYLDRDLQHQVIGTFNYALLPGGYLFLGSSESADSPPLLFRPVDRDARIFQATERPSDKLPVLPRITITPRLPEWPVARTQPSPAQTETSLHRQALEDIAPPSVLVDERYYIVHLSETAGRFLQHPGGGLTSDITELARPELRVDLRSALHRAFEQSQPSLSLPIAVRFNGNAHRVYLQVKPVPSQDHARHVLIIFIEGGPIENAIEGDPAAEEGRSVAETIQQLRDELQATRARLKASREEEEAANEELRAANEELQSINEEYRSTAEELETSKEELQSINEELQTLNNELKLKLESVSRAHNDLQNLMAATDVGTLFLDSHLRIKRLTPRVADLFNITTNDEGRSITDFTHRLDYDSLPADAQDVLKNLVPVEREVQSSSGTWFLMRLRPYRTLDDKIEGVVATFVDVTERRLAEEALRSSETRLKLAREASDLGIQDHNVLAGEFWLDERARSLWGIKPDEKVTAELLWSRVHPEDLPQARSAFGKALDPRGDGVYATEFRIRADPDCWLRANGKTFFGGDKKNRRAERLVATFQDVTDRKTWEIRQQLLLSELSHRVKNTLAVVQSMARQTFRHAKNHKDALASFEGRLGALANAHDLLVSSNWQGAQIDSLIRRQLGTQFFSDGRRLHLEGPTVMLSANLATPFSLLLHELGTNALKYGALSADGGTVSLTWNLHPNPEPTLVVNWREEGGPAPDSSPGSGFGTYLIQNGLPNAKVTRDARPSGMEYRIELRLGV
jgi:two-component system, chemotaxis family, CheB/CheR fusion protein